MQHALQMRQIYKRFGDVIANNYIDFILHPGEIHALLGGMVTQHFALAQPLTVTENIVLGATTGWHLDLEQAHQIVAAAAAKYGIPVDPRARVENLSVGEQQRVEILKSLYRQVKILVLDEPTTVLVPQEVAQLFTSLRNLRDAGYAVVFISHKLHEVMEITDRVTVLRDGRKVGTTSTADITQAELANMMVGRETFGVSRSLSSRKHDDVALEISNVTVRDKRQLPVLSNISLSVHVGEILGIAGVSGNGQTELGDLLAGTEKAEQGQVKIYDRDFTNCSPQELMKAGVGRIPENCRVNVVEEMSVAQNIIIEKMEAFIRHGVLDRKKMLDYANRLIENYQIKAMATDKIRTLSGGNLQKVVLARVLEQQPAVIIVSQPTRGLDVGATEYVRQKLMEQCESGAAILLISEDLDEILALSDRIAVMYEGQVMGVLAAENADLDQIGLLMSGIKP